jgi:hypothetical protein
MLFRRLTIGLAAVGFFGSPVASLYCPSDDPAAMACCQRDANDCNQRGKSDDCCRTVPTDGQTAAAASKAGDLAKPQWIAAPAAILPALLLAADGPSVSVRTRSAHLVQDLPPPPLAVLRI